MSGRERRTRRSAMQAKKMFKEVAGDSDDNLDDNSTNTVTPSKKRKRNEDEDFDVSNDEIEEVDDEGNSGEAEEEYEDVDDETAETRKRSKIDDNTLTKMRKEVLEFWKDYFTPPNTGLKDVPAELIQKWKKMLPKKPKKGQPKKNKPIPCPNSGCGKKFLAAAGLAYHYARCGVDTKSSNEYKCNLCPFVSSNGVRMVIPHLKEDHIEVLPTIPDRLKEALSYKKLINTPTVKVRTKDGRKSTFKTFVTFDDYVDETKKYHLKQLNLNLFPNLCPYKYQWKPNYMSMNVPQEETSVKFKYNHNSSSEWSWLNLFESVIDDVNGHSTFFVGGPVWSSTWVPYPIKHVDTIEEQILVISAALNFDSIHPFSDLEPEPGFIQFWNFGQLSTKDERKDVNPVFEFGIAHNYGLVWDMEFCPFGNTYQNVSDYKKSPNSDVLPRLGLLSLACADGYVRILSIPHVNSIRTRTSSVDLKTKIFSPNPVILLHPPGVGPSVNNLPGICKCVSWSRTNDCVDVAAGYGNGIVAYWNLATKSKLLIVEDNSTQKKQLQLLPTKSWLGHSSSVNSIKWCPYEGVQMIASGGTVDRTIFLWNLDDLNVPIRILKRGYVTDIDWIYRFSGLFVSFDDCFLSLKSNTNYIELADEDGRNTLSPHRSTVWSLSYSDWLNSEASADSSGECLIFHDFHYKVHHHSKWKRVRKEPLYRIKLLPFNYIDTTQEKEEVEPNVSKTKKGKKGKAKKVNEYNEDGVDIDRLPPNSNHYRYDGISQDIGLVFVDHSLSKERFIDPKEFERLNTETMTWVNPSHYPLASINQIKWNPNYSSFTYIFTGTQSGLCRLSNCTFLMAKKRSIDATKDKADDNNIQQDEDE